VGTALQRNAKRIETVSERKQHVDIEYRALTVANPDRENAIINVLRFYEAKNAMVFCNTRAAVNHLMDRLNNRGFSVVALSGELSQNERTHALQAMRDGRARVCIATDVAARGIDLPNLELVIHADLPTNPDTLLHRSGRTGRAGRKGVSALIIPTSARRRTERLLQTASLRAEWASPPSADDVNARDDERLLDHEAFAEPVRDDERAFLSMLLDRHGAELIAAAFMRQYRASHSAPEDLVDLGPAQTSVRPARAEKFPVDAAPRGRNEDFGASRWISLSVGRKQNAEPRWLIPLLCRAGDITKRDIGQIKMMQEETFVQLSEDSVEAFLHHVGPNRTLERGIRLGVLDGEPDFGGGARGAPKKFADKKPYADRKPAWDKPAREDRDGPGRERPAREKTGFSKKSDPVAEEFGATNTKKKFGRKPEFAATDRAYSDKPGKSWGKPSKPGTGKSGPSNSGPNNSGDDRPKRKKPKNF
jgi:ATP-dependent RNA helicase DeaD